MNDEGLADVEAANPFRLPRLHPGIGVTVGGRCFDDGRVHRSLAHSRQRTLRAVRVEKRTARGVAGHAYFVDAGWSRAAPPVASGHT